jgi:hypothetical protein
VIGFVTNLIFVELFLRLRRRRPVLAWSLLGAGWAIFEALLIWGLWR